mgnify:CR=1 FL=1
MKHLAPLAEQLLAKASIKMIFVLWGFCYFQETSMAFIWGILKKDLITVCLCRILKSNFLLNFDSNFEIIDFSLLIFTVGLFVWLVLEILVFLFYFFRSFCNFHLVDLIFSFLPSNWNFLKLIFTLAWGVIFMICLVLKIEGAHENH